MNVDISSRNFFGIAIFKCQTYQIVNSFLKYPFISDISDTYISNRTVTVFCYSVFKTELEIMKVTKKYSR